jgi:NAD(P)-dependent dehydrogenase (short-subunit alcohol dehydrogenase family)
VITGAARGGGLGIARSLARHTGALVLVGRSTRARPNRLLPGTLEDTREELAAAGADAVCFPADISRAPERDALCKFLADEYGGCDILVNNAAYNPRLPFTELPPHRWEAVFEVNLNAPVALARAMLPAMLTRGSGHIINIGSAAAVNDYGPQLAYAASKAALERFTTGLAAELSGTGVSVNCVRVDEALRTEALAALYGEQESGPSVSLAAFGDAVRWIVQQPPGFTGQVLTFGRLRELGGLAASAPEARDAAG